MPSFLKFITISVFSLKRGTMTQHHAVCQIHHAEQNEFRTKNHHIGHNVVWEKDFPWHVPVYNTAGTTVVGLLCLICKRHNMRKVLFTSDAPTLDFFLARTLLFV